MKCPSKKELADLQKRFRTDKKIADLFGVAPHLVAYWRRKKGIPAYSSPKYGKNQVMEVWEQYGDDRLAGRALGVSGNAFRYWRKKYGISGKPSHLKLEQLQLPLPGIDRFIGKSAGKSLMHKIIESKSDSSFQQSDAYFIDPDRIYVGNSKLNFLELLKQNDIRTLKNPSKVYALYQGNVMENGYKKEFIKLRDYGNLSIPSNGGHIYDAITKGNILPSELIVSSDPAVMGVGAIGAFGLQAVESKLAEVLATGRTSIQRFDTYQIILLDHPPKHIEPLDIILFLKSRRDLHKMPGTAIEYSGDSIEYFDLEQRFTLCYLSRLFDCLSACMPCDKRTEKYLRKKAIIKFRPITSDLGNIYSGSLRQSILEIEPSVGIIRNGDFVIEPLSANLNLKVDTVISGFYSGGMYRDIFELSVLLNKKKVDSGVRMFVKPSTKEIALRLLEEGIHKQLHLADCQILPPSAEMGDIGFPAMQPSLGSILTTDPSALALIPENYPHPVYLANHQVAGVSALNGCLSDPRA